MPRRRGGRNRRNGPTSLEPAQQPQQNNNDDDFIDSFYTTTWVYQEKGMAKIPACCLDSGANGDGAAGNINPSVVDAMGFQRITAQRESTLADGSRNTTTSIVRVPLTFHTEFFARTVEVELRVCNTDVPGQNMLLNTGVQNALGGVHDHSTNPSTFQITSEEYGDLEHLIPDTIDAPTRATWFAKKSPRYLEELIYSPAFAEGGIHTLLDVARDFIGSSHHIVYVIRRLGITVAPVNAQCLELVNLITEMEHELYAEYADTERARRPWLTWKWIRHRVADYNVLTW